MELNSLRPAGVLRVTPAGRRRTARESSLPRPPLRHVLLLLLGASALGWGAIRGWEAWHYHDELARAERDVASGKYAEARERLIPLSRRWPGRAELEFRLGICEASLGHVEPALEAWGRVPAGSVLAPADGTRAREAVPRARAARGGGGEPRPDRGLLRPARRGGRPARPATRPVLGEGVPHPAADRAPLGLGARPGGPAPDPLALRDAALPRAGGPRRPRADEPRGPPGRSGLARAGRRRRPHGPARRGRSMADGLRGPSARRPRRPACAPRVGHRGAARGRRGGDAETPPREPLHARGTGLALGPPRRAPRRPRRGAAGAGASRRAGARRRLGVGEARRPGDPRTGRGSGPPRTREGA